MATKKVIEEAVEMEVSNEEQVVVPKVLSRYRIEKHGDDATVFERIVLPEEYANEKGVKEFVGPNGKITYYMEKQAKRYSENVVKA